MGAPVCLEPKPSKKIPRPKSVQPCHVCGRRDERCSIPPYRRRPTYKHMHVYVGGRIYGCPCGATLPTAKLLAGLPRKSRARSVREKGGMRKKHEHAEHAPRCSCLSSCSQGAFLLGNKVFGLVFPAFNRGPPGPLSSLKLSSPSITSCMRLTGMARFALQVAAAQWPRLGLGSWTGIGARATIERSRRPSPQNGFFRISDVAVNTLKAKPSKLKQCQLMARWARQDNRNGLRQACTRRFDAESSASIGSGI